MVGLELGFEPVTCDFSVAAHLAGVVDENVDDGELLLDLLGEGSHTGEVGEVQFSGEQAVLWQFVFSLLAPQDSDDVGTLLQVSVAHHHLGAPQSQVTCRLLAHARTAPRDHDDVTVQPVLLTVQVIVLALGLGGFWFHFGCCSSVCFF